MEYFYNIFNEFIKNNNIYCGKIIKRNVIFINKDFVVIDSKLKSESYISINEFIDNKNNIEVKVGDEVELLLEQIEDGKGNTILSRKKAKIYKSWLILENFYRNNKSVIGEIIEKVKGGFIVLINNIKGFLPGSLMDFKLINSNLEGQKFELKIINIDKKNNNIILSRKALIQSNYSLTKEDFLDNIYINDIIKGVVKNITDYGVFIDLGYIDGLLHITDITWKRIKHPSEIVKIGDEINVKVLNFDKKTSRVSLGLKQLTKDPWINIENKYPYKFKIFGKVTNILDYGFFIEIEDGIEGLVHVSEINNKIKNFEFSKKINKDDIIQTYIISINSISRRISLGFENNNINIWNEFCNSNKINDKVYCIIKDVTNIGIFVKINEYIDGIILNKDISDFEICKNNKYKKGDKIYLTILYIDNVNLKVFLGIE